MKQNRLPSAKAVELSPSGRTHLRSLCTCFTLLPHVACRTHRACALGLEALGMLLSQGFDISHRVLISCQARWRIKPYQGASQRQGFSTAKWIDNRHLHVGDCRNSRGRDEWSRNGEHALENGVRVQLVRWSVTVAMLPLLTSQYHLHDTLLSGG